MQNNSLLPILAALLLCCSSCFFIPIKKPDNKTKEQAEIELYKEKIKKSYREDGSLLSTVTYRGKDRHGLSHNFYPNGIIQATIPYHYNKKHGDVIWYYKSGKTYRITPYAQGQKNGLRKVFYEDGTLQSTQTFKHDIPQDDLTEYNAYGDKKKNYVDWGYKIVDKRKSNAYVDVVFAFKRPVKNPEFFHQALSERDTLNLPVSKINNRHFIRIPAKEGSVINESIPIIARYTTEYRNTYVSNRTIKIHVPN
jgi:hypothetical protein